MNALEPFSIDARLATEASTEFTFEWFSVADFETAGGLSYTLSTNQPGATIVPTGAGGTVDGRLWHDLNANEVKDATEPDLEGFRLFLDVNQNGVFESASEPSSLTDANGIYAITNVSPGVYDLILDLPAGWEQTSPLDTSGNPIIDTVPVTDGVISTARPFGAREIPGRVQGVVWHDLNADGIRGADEPSLSDWLVYLDANDNGVRDAGEPSIRSSQIDGSYTLANLPPGQQIIAIERPDGWASSVPVDGRVAVTVAPQQTVQVEFGNYEANGVIEGNVFHDANGNGQRDPGEAAARTGSCFSI